MSNEEWAYLLVDQLVQQGVTYFCLSPGSRSAPLALAVARHPQAHTFVHFDERGMAFHALGYAKATLHPVALIVTSGTAVANLFPAVMEAFFSQVPLILLTADRPPELRDNGANQAVDQVKIFGSYVRWSVDLPCKDPHIPLAYLKGVVAHSVYVAKRSPRGPVHLNCMFREPLVSLAKEEFSPSICHSYATSFVTLSPEAFAAWASSLKEQPEGLIVGGYFSSSFALTGILSFAETLGWPVIADITSPLRRAGSHAHLIPHYDYLFSSSFSPSPKFILHLGDRLVSKNLMRWLSTQKQASYCLVADHSYRHDPLHLVTHRIEMDPALFCGTLSSLVSSQATDKSWLKSWQKSSQLIGKKLAAFFSDVGEVSEPYLFYFLSSHLPEEWALFLSNSMPIRDAEALFFPASLYAIYANRGASGIDGNIATAIGIAQGCKRPLLAVFGDLAALHDLNSWAQLKHSSYPLISVILNNQGGAIFSFLPTRQKKEVFEEYFAAAHSYTFKDAAHFFDLPYYPVSSMQEWVKAFTEATQTKKSCIIEVFTNREENYALHENILSYLHAPTLP